MRKLTVLLLSLYIPFAAAAVPGEDAIEIALNGYLSDAFYVEDMGEAQEESGTIKFSAKLKTVDDLFLPEKIGNVLLLRKVSTRNSILDVEGEVAVSGGKPNVKSLDVKRRREGEKKYRGTPVLNKALTKGELLVSLQDQSYVIVQAHNNNDVIASDAFTTEKEKVVGWVFSQFFTGTFTSDKVNYVKKGKWQKKSDALSLAFSDEVKGVAWLNRPASRHCNNAVMRLTYWESDKFFVSISSPSSKCSIPKLGSKLFITFESENELRLTPHKGEGYILLTRKEET